MSTAIKIKNASVDNNNKSIKKYNNNKIKDNNKINDNNKIKDNNNKNKKDGDKNKKDKDKNKIDEKKKEAKPKSEKGMGIGDNASTETENDGPPLDKYGNPFPIENPEGGDPICPGGYKIDYQFDPLNDPINPPFNCIPILKGPGSLAGKLLAMANNPSAGVKILAEGEVPSFGGRKTRRRRHHLRRRSDRTNKRRSRRRRRIVN